MRQPVTYLLTLACLLIATACTGDDGASNGVGDTGDAASDVSDSATADSYDAMDVRDDTSDTVDGADTTNTVDSSDTSDSPDVSTACDPDAGYEEMPRPNEGLTESVLDAACPEGMVSVTDFCIDAYEAALVEVLDGGGERSWSPYFNPGGRTVRAVSIEGAIPQGYITGEQSRAACQQAGKRLCTSIEWLRACRGADNSTYPYGDTRQPGVCNDSRAEHPVIDYFDTTDEWIWSELANACIGQQDDTVEPAGDHTGCTSPDGTHDMMGNLHEWVADTSGTFRGGFYADTSINGEGCLYATTAHSTQHWDYSTGFRCCADP